MTVPTQSSYPAALDTDDNLFEVHDSLRLRLLLDYNPGDKTIYVEGDPVIFRRFPRTGLVTLTEQCSDVDRRALSFYYSSVDYAGFTIGGLELLEDFAGRDSVKPRRITDVTQNVMSKHHNLVKDAVIAVERFIGVKGTVDPKPLGQTMEGRVNFLRKLVLSPRAYFTADRKIGLIPLTVTFKDLSFRLGTDNASHDIVHLWDFGDNTVSAVSSSGVSTISVTDEVLPSCVEDVFVSDLDGGEVTKTYCSPGNFDVTLTVTNEFGSDTITIPGLINARVHAPDPAVVDYVAGDSQQVTSGGVFVGDDYVPPVIRSPINTLVKFQIAAGENPHNPGHTFAGEPMTSGGSVIDPVVSYTWSLGDDLNHSTATSATKASYGVGGLYDMKIRVDTKFGAYRITSYDASVDVVERQNIWMFNYPPGDAARVVAFEYGLISETFKTSVSPSYVPVRDDTFLSANANAAQMKREFFRNTGFVPKSNLASGDRGDAVLFYAGGRPATQPPSFEEVRFAAFNGFAGTFADAPGFSRPWNWVNFNSPTTAYFLFGAPTSNPAPFQSPANPAKSEYSITTGVVVQSTMTASNFSNGADELLTNVSQFNDGGASVFGNFSVTRAAFKNNVGYVLRNENVGDFFRIKSFYRTEGTLGSPVQTVKKLAGMPGPTKLEGELLAMTPGLFFFNNSGSISAYSDAGGVWETGGPGVSSIAFRALQDQAAANFDDTANPLLAVSDGDNRAYLSYDYSAAALVKFNALNLTFSSLANRPPGRQWVLGLY